MQHEGWEAVWSGKFEATRVHWGKNRKTLILLMADARIASAWSCRIRKVLAGRLI